MIRLRSKISIFLSFSNDDFSNSGYNQKNKVNLLDIPSDFIGKKRRSEFDNLATNLLNPNSMKVIETAKRMKKDNNKNKPHSPQIVKRKESFKRDRFRFATK